MNDPHYCPVGPYNQHYWTIGKYEKSDYWLDRLLFIKEWNFYCKCGARLKDMQ